MKRRQQRLTLIGVFAIFLIPIASAWYLRLNPIDGPTSNRGVLVDPPVQFNATNLTVRHAFNPPKTFLRDEWTIVMLTDGACGSACEQALHASKQARIAVNKDFDRVRRLLLTSQRQTPSVVETHIQEHPDLAVGSAGGEWRQQFEASAAGQVTAAYLVDPRGFQFMRYPAPLVSADLLKDLKRLLKISKVD